MLYKINVYFEAFRQYEVEAETLEKGMDMAYDQFSEESEKETLKKATYVPCSAHCAEVQ